MICGLSGLLQSHLVANFSFGSIFLSFDFGQVWQRFRWLPNVAPVKLPLAGFVVPKGAVAVLTGWGESVSFIIKLKTTS